MKSKYAVSISVTWFYAELQKIPVNRNSPVIAALNNRFIDWAKSTPRRLQP
jgi:hypothetical protein